MNNRMGWVCNNYIGKLRYDAHVRRAVSQVEEPVTQ